MSGQDPYATIADRDRAFWADAVADAVEDRDPAEPIVIKGGVSPSGVPHIGHLNEIVRGYIVAEVLRDRGHDVRQVFTADDRDRLRKVPRQLADLDWNVVGLEAVDAGVLGRNLGKPYTSIPDPFGCCDSYGDHFTTLLARSAEMLGIPIDVVSNTALYAEGAFEAVTRRVLANSDRARRILADYQDSVDETYVPFQAECQACGILTDGITDVDPDSGTVAYECRDVTVGEETIAGCGHEGEVSLRAGKLPWRFEWPAQWSVLAVDFEPFGKDHAEGSWPSGVAIAEGLLDVEPPVPMVYEWFTLNGEALSSSSGNVVTAEDVLGMLEPEVLRYFFVKDPRKQRDFDVAHLDQLVDEFDRFERVFFDEVDAYPETEQRAAVAYPIVVEDVRPERIRIPYTFAAVLGMTEDPELLEEIARREGHIPAEAPEWAVEEALARVERARAWARRTDNAFNYDLKREELPTVEFDPDTRAALDDLAAFVADGRDGEAIQRRIYELADEYDLDVGEFFAAGYRLLFDLEEGPQLGPFLAKLDREFVVARLRREA